MQLPIYQIDAFTDKTFGGNPAAVVPLESWLPDEVMQNIAIENNLSETAFFIPHKDSYYLRWFTPTYEIDLCGHATLATSHVILNELYAKKNKVKFYTNEAGELIVTKKNDVLEMDFPSRPGKKINIENIPEVVLSSLNNATPIEAYKSRDLLLIFDNEEFIRNIQPNFSTLIQYPDAVIVSSTTKNKNYDFISRFFCPYDISIPEDPVTGSAHCTLIPYWANRLNKTYLRAYQASSRGGDLKCTIDKDRVFIKGKTKLYLKGHIYV